MYFVQQLHDMSRECRALRLKGAGHRGDAGGSFGGNPWRQAAFLLTIVFQRSTKLFKPGLLLGELLAHGKGWEAGGGGSGAAGVPVAASGRIAARAAMLQLCSALLCCSSRLRTPVARV